MNAHVTPPPAAEDELQIFHRLEPHICDLARLSLAVSIIAEDVRRDLLANTKLNRWPADLLDVNKGELELLFAYVDDTKRGAMALREMYYGERAA